MMASGEIRLSGTMMRRMPVLAQSQTCSSCGTVWGDPNDISAGVTVTASKSFWSTAWNFVSGLFSGGSSQSPLNGVRMNYGTFIPPLSLGAGVAAGVAKISQYAGAAHFSIEVSVGGESLATEQMIIDDLGNTTIASNTSTGAVQTWSVALPNGQAALDFSSSVIGTDTGVYNAFTNSCLSYCGNVLNAGGLNVPLNSTLGMVRFLQALGAQ
jgi:hypothetical protein